MTTLTMRFFKNYIVVTGADFEPMKFKSRLGAPFCLPRPAYLIGASSILASAARGYPATR